ncbi:MAG: VOC family protein [Phycisphaeraceae bacterium]|nr:VOC family protein [Phycisphaeraceae bacterium]
MHIAQFALTVRDYDEAIAFFCNKLGFTLLEDTDMGAGKRWVRVQPPSPPSATSPAILLARAASKEQLDSVGNQTGGRVFIFLHTDNIARDFDLYTSRGVTFISQPRREAFGTVAVFLDLYRNKWDLIQPSVGPRTS